MSGGGGGSWWKAGLPAGIVLVVGAAVLEHAGLQLPLLINLLLAAGGLLTIASACETMILAAGGLAGKLRWNEYVAGVIASLASNIPEVAMIGFVVAADVRVAFVVTLLTLHINALVFSIFCVLLPRDEHGRAALPKPISLLGSDMLVGAAGLMIVLGLLMLAMAVFDGGAHAGLALGRWDLVMIALVLLVVLVVYVLALVRRFSGAAEPAAPVEGDKVEEEETVSWSHIALYGGLGSAGALIGGHAVGDFADNLVGMLRSAGYSELIGAIVVAGLAGVPAYILVTSAHLKGRTQLALSNVFGAIVQVPFVILPAVLLFAVLFVALGVVPSLPQGGLLPIDLETVSVVLFAFPTLLILWKSISDDGAVNKLETTIMVALFALVLYLLAAHG